MSFENFFQGHSRFFTRFEDPLAPFLIVSHSTLCSAPILFGFFQMLSNWDWVCMELYND